ncbi:MAG: hypothetical protein Q8P30_00315 [Candidatus Uhrbacteria bacterium]|nr:hypothetical protein [Candidatus Uhrbacteria bacterium]
MQISNHYLPYTEKTLIILTNNEFAKLFSAFEREVEELEVMEVTTQIPKQRSTGTPNSGPPDVDEIKRHSRMELYGDLSVRVLNLIKDGYTNVVLCAPEAYKNEIIDAMHTDVQNMIGDVIPKNLAMLPLDQVIRILQENRA